MCRTVLLAVLLAVSTQAALAAYDFSLLSTLPPLYDFLNATGLDDYPLSNCWLFPQPAISLVVDATAYQVAFEATPTSGTDGAAVANAWCLEKGFGKAVDFRKADFNAGQPPAPSLYLGDGSTGTGSAFKYIECASPPAVAGCSRDNNNNQGWNNTGTGNLGNSNLGSSNVGDFNQGSANVGLFISGSASKGVGLTCSACVAGDSMLAVQPGFIIPGST